jgi:uncharacterized protein (TIGR02001 family)
MTMRKILLAAAFAATLVSPIAVSTAQAQAAAAPASPHTFTGNLTVGSDYRFRGISQTFKGPTVQGGIDYSHASGFYLGNWNSNVSGLTYNNGGGIEMDFYGGWKGSWGDWGLDVGGLYYYYDSARWNGMTNGSAVVNTSGKYNNGEIYIAGSWKFLSAKYSYAVTDYFGINSNYARNTQSKDCFMGVAGACGGTRAGFLTGTREDRGDSKGSSYIELNATYEVAPKWNLIGHIGKTTVKNYGELSYSDIKVGVTYDLSGWALGGAIVGTNANKQWYSGQRTVAGTANTRDLGTTTLVLSVAKSF